MRTFVNWLMPRRPWLALVAAASVQFVPSVSAGLLIADGAARGPARALPLAVVVLVAVVLLSLGSGEARGFAMVAGAVTVVSGYLVGWLLDRSRSLELTFQSTILIACMLAVGLAVVGPGPDVLAAPLIAQLVGFMEVIGATAEQLELIRAWDPVALLGFMFAGILIQVLAALMLGCWMFSVVRPEVAFGRQFSGLRLGRIVGILSMVVLTIGMFVPWSAVQYLKTMAVIGFLFQGLAVMHAWIRAKKWHWGIAAAVYASVLTPLSGLVVAGLCAAGLIDNIFSLRRPLESGA